MFTTAADRHTFYAALHEGHPSLILLHGASADHRLWLPAARAVSGHRVLLPDLPAHGQTEGPPLQSISAMADFTLGFMAALDIERAVVGGHSMGGAVALHMALHHPERLAGVALVSTIPHMRVNREVLHAAEHDHAQLADFFATYAYGPSADAALVARGREMITAGAAPHHADFAACSRFDVRNEVASISLPVLIVCGREDHMTPAKHARLMAEQIPQAELHIIDHAGHMLLVETPRILADRLNGWLPLTN
jgi:pimeloyl-ACP methyl ester carboxylesterase